MSLALRLLIYFGLLALFATVTVGYGARDAWRRMEEQRFEEQLHAAKLGVLREIAWEASQIRDLLQPKCEHDTDIDRTLIDLERGHGDLDPGRRLAVSQLVPEEMKALHLDELLLFTGTGEILGAGHESAAAGRVEPTLSQAASPRGPNVAFRAAKASLRP